MNVEVTDSVVDLDKLRLPLVEREMEGVRVGVREKVREGVLVREGE